MSQSSKNSVGMIATVIGILVSCITIFSFVTGIVSLNLFGKSENSNTQRAEEYVPSSAEEPNTQPEFSSNESSQSTPVISGIRNPTGRIAAGELIIVDDFSLIVKPSFVIDEGWEGETLIYIEIVVTNLSNKSRLFSYNRPNSLSLKDDLGNSFSPFDNASDFYQSFQFSFNSEKSVTFESAYNAHGELQIPVFEGEIASGASQLMVVFNGFGPFSGFEVSIDL